MSDAYQIKLSIYTPFCALQKNEIFLKPVPPLRRNDRRIAALRENEAGVCPRTNSLQSRVMALGPRSCPSRRRLSLGLRVGVRDLRQFYLVLRFFSYAGELENVIMISPSGRRVQSPRLTRTRTDREPPKKRSDGTGARKSRAFQVCAAPTRSPPLAVTDSESQTLAAARRRGPGALETRRCATVPAGPRCAT
jgi:hypothetical protein